MKRAQMATVPTMAPMMAPVWLEGWSGGGVEVEEDTDDVIEAEEEEVVTVDIESVERELGVALGRTTLDDEAGRKHPSML